MARIAKIILFCYASDEARLSSNCFCNTTGKTASGERFNRWGYTAASFWRRLGSRVRVINPRNRRRVVVRINDHLPPGHADLDLSYAAFRKIANPRKGLVKVCVVRVSR
ncbi:MAG: hypothetical protein JO235_02135 [Chroococcidiopsidaceae cyanobacterium CP_BM_RX_35]|nr:hypothetical protein [Chroococcidiopsidaceae cyanobacterium CP_BM_RX_35]